MNLGTRRAGATLAVAVALVAIAAVAVVRFATAPNGPGLSVDSASYELAAEHYGDAPELVPLVLNGVFPPGYPAAMAGAGVVVDPMRDAALVVNQAALVAVLALSAMAVWRGRREAGEGPGSALVGAVLAVGLLAISPALLRWTGYVMAEVLSIALLLAALVVGERGLRRSSVATLAAAGGLTGLATVVRHGAAGAAVAIAVVALVHRGWRSRQGMVAVLATLAAAGGTWLSASLLLLGERPRSQRAIVWHPPGLADLRQAGETLAGYWAPSSLPVAVAVVLVAAGLAASIWWAAARVRRGPGVALVTWLAVAIAVAHLVVLVASKALVDDAIVADDRLLLPLLPLLVVALAATWPAPSRALPATALLVLVLVVAGAEAERTVDWVRQARREGIELGQRRFVGSPTLAATRSLPPTEVVWTDQVSLLSLHAGRQAFPVPVRYDSYSGLDDDDFPAEVDALARAVAAGEAVVVFLEAFPDDRSLALEELLAVAPHLAVARFPDGAVVSSPGGGP